MHISFADTKLYELLVNKNGYIREEYDNYIKINFQKNPTTLLFSKREGGNQIVIL